ncbi:MAG: 2-C-methyl-D-erythritol 4-phosphate cytidylyltransferase, partial [Candidatus Omnitrophota bacterium]
AILPAAGSGERMRSKIDKPFMRLRKHEIIYYSLRVLEDSPVVSEIIIAVKDENMPRVKKLIKRECFKKVKNIVRGGRKRAQSVFNALLSVSEDADFVLIHDAARPFITQKIIRDTVNAAKRYGASLSAVNVLPTVKEAGIKGGFVKKTLDRRFLWQAQTPQVIKKDILLSAYKRIGKSFNNFTDEVSLVEAIGGSVKIVKGSYGNIKITKPEDIAIAEALLKVKNKNCCRV